MTLNDQSATVAVLKERVKGFVQERNWEKYHNPKDLAESISIEAAELLEVFQWASAEKALDFKNDPTRLRRVREELADVLIYCLSMTNSMELDLSVTITDKLVADSVKYPIDKCRERRF